MSSLWLVLIAVGCGNPPPSPAPQTSADSPKATSETATPEKLAVKHLPNALRIHDKVISGGLPEGDAAFRELQSLGVRTVISVDGAKPDVETARKFGMRYVHLPHGYDGIPKERVEQLAKAVRELPGPIYIHCHHGKHRSPAAAAVACVGAGLIPADRSLAVLQVAGTSEGYRGLFDSAREARPFESALLDQLKGDFPEKAALPPLAEAMVAVEHTHDHLKKIAAAGWKTPPSHPALAPRHEALLLREHFTELLRFESNAGRPADFLESLKTSETAARQLEDALAQGGRTPDDSAWRDAAQKAFDRVTAECKACHTAHRDVPLSRKQK